MAGQCPHCGAELSDPGGPEHLCSALPRDGAVTAQPPASAPPSSAAPPLAPPPAPVEPAAVPPPRVEWILAAAIGASVALLLAAVVAWRLADASLLPTVESLGGPDNVDTVVPIPPVPPPLPPSSAGEDGEDDELPIEVPAEIDVVPDDSAEPAGSASAPASSD